MVLMVLSLTHLMVCYLSTYLPDPQIHLIIVQFIRRATSGLTSREKWKEVSKNDIRAAPALLSSVHSSVE